jgi:ankyrin repeat protein
MLISFTTSKFHIPAGFTRLRKARAGLRDSAALKNFFNAMAGFFKGDPNKVDENGFTRLQRAVMNNDLGKVVSLIKSGADVNFRGGMLMPPLHLALDNDRHGIAVALIQAGADIDLRDAQGRTPLHHAAMQTQDSFVHMLLKLGANPNLTDEDGRTPLHVLGTARPALVDILAAYGANPNVRDADGKTPLHLFLDRPLMVERLLRNKADPNVRDADGFSPFMYMIDDEKMTRHPQVLQHMLSAADIRAVNGRGESLLHLCARLERADTFAVAFSRADLAQKDKDGNSVLHVLARCQNAAMISRVLDRAPELLSEKNNAGRTPLGEMCDDLHKHHWATVPKGLEGVVRMMLAHGADPDACDRAGRTMLHYAAASGRGDLAASLIDHKAATDLADARGIAPLHLAIEKKDMDILDLLLDRGADPDLTDDRGWTVLDRLAERGDRDSPIVQRLIVAGGQYCKQLPLNPGLMRPRAGTQEDAPAEKGLLDKPSGNKVLRLPPARGSVKPSADGAADGRTAASPKRGTGGPKP